MERSELKWNEMKCFAWHAWIEMKELKRMNWNAWIDMNELKWKNWHEWIGMRDLTWLTWNEGIEMKELKPRNWNEGIETHELKRMNELTWMNWYEQTEMNWFKWMICLPHLQKGVKRLSCFCGSMWNKALATVSCTFCGPHLPKVVRDRQLCTIFIKPSSRYSLVHLLSTSSLTSGKN